MRKPQQKRVGVLVRLPKDMVDSVGEVLDVVAVSQQQFFEDCLRVYFGDDDFGLVKRRETVLEGVKQGKIERPFDDPTVLMPAA